MSKKPKGRFGSTKESAAEAMIARDQGLETKETPSIVPATPSGDQNEAPAQASGDQNDVKAKAKTKKKPSPTVTGWKERKKHDLPLEARINILGDYATACPKRGDAKRRFELYTDGMTVAKYLEVTKEAGIRGALAKDDIHWDLEKGFINLTQG